MLARSARNGALPMIVERRAASARSRGRGDCAGSSAARTRWPSVWPSGISRTPAEIQLAGDGMQKGVQRRRQRNAVAGAATPTATG